jgi:alkylated DNA nucleotide flippase Atl1
MITGFLSSVGEKLAERWLMTLALPGLLFVALAAAGHGVGQRDALRWSAFTTQVHHLAKRWNEDPAVAVLTVAAALIAAAGAGLAARMVGTAVERLWLATGPAWWRRLAVHGTVGGRKLLKGRLQRWTEACAAYDSATRGHAESAEDFRRRRAWLADARNRIGLAPPQRPTWMADRLRVVGQRVEGQYGIDLTTAWPRLWLVMPADARDELRTTNEAFTGSAVRLGWAALYVILGAFVWWPAAVAGAVLMVTGWRAARMATETLASLVESAVDVNVRTLARELGLEVPSGQLTLATGRELTERMRKGT